MSPHAVPKFVLVLVPSFLVILCSISLSNACTGLEACTSLEQEDWSGSGSISIPTFDGIDEQQSLVVLKNAEIWRDVLRLPASNTSSSGSVLLPFRMELWQQVDSGGMMKNEASFTTTLRFMIISSPTAAASLAFVVVPSLNAADGSLPPALNTANSTTTTTSNNNHSLALDLGSIMSGYSTAVNYTVWIDYDGIRRLMLAYIANDGDPKPSEALFATPLTMSDRVPNKAYVGFMASGAGGQGNSEIFGFLSWNMTVERAGDKRAGQMSKKRQLEYGLMAVILFFSLFCIALIVTLVFLRQNNNETKDELDKVLTCVARKLKYSEISDATNGFSSEVLGEGAFGVVYKGKLSTGKDDEKQERQVAVKKFKESGYWQQYSEFLDEIQVIIQLRHNNIVRLLGWCCEKQEFMLVYQYMHNGSLDKHLFEYSFLAWETRYRIVGDIAAGLHYIHHELDNVVIHRDIKSSNILLDHSLRGCLGDFGLAQVVARGRRSSSSTGTAGMGSASAAGTEGYIAPEYEASGKATVASDVYAFGVVILEIVTRREVFDDSQPSGSTHLVDWVRNEFHDKGKPLLEAVDRDLTGGGRWRRHDAAEAERLLLLGLACTSTDPSDRPITRDVLKIIDKTLPPPVVPPHRNIPRGASTRPTPVGGLGLPSISVHDADDASITITRSRFRRSIAFLCQGHMTFRSEEAQV